MKFFRQALGIVVVCALALCGAWASGGSSSSSSSSPTPSTPSKSPAEQARDHYDQGLKARDKAWTLEERAVAAQTVEEREKLLGKAQKQYAKAVEDFKEAVALDATFHQAFSSLGYASRKTGDYDYAIRAYNTALELSPDYSEAIEYRAEAYLGLGEVEKAKQAYMRLFNLDREKADELLAAMKEWIGDRRKSPGAPGGDMADALDEWVKKRDEIASQGSKVSRNGGRGW